MSEFHVRTAPISEIIPYARNPRKNEIAIDKVAASIKEFGWRQPIVVDPEMVIIAGHTRLQAAKRLGMANVPVHIADGLTDAQIKAYRLADNRSGQEAEWDIDLLALELDELQDIDISLTGFDADEIAEMMIKGGEVGLPSLADGDKSPFQQMTFTVYDDQAEQVRIALDQAKSLGGFDSLNENSNGNALARICETFNGLS